jgi:hypothetical protein
VKNVSKQETSRFRSDSIRTEKVLAVPPKLLPPSHDAKGALWLRNTPPAEWRRLLFAHSALSACSCLAPALMFLLGDRRLKQIQGSIDLGQFALVLGTLVRTEVSLLQTIYQLPFLREQLRNDH